MDFKTQTNQQPQVQAQPVQPVQQSTGPQDQFDTGSRKNGNSNGKRKLVALVVSLLMLAVLATGLVMLWQSKQTQTSGTDIEADKYQALFMTNGQVYFGHLSDLDANYTNLTDVYYLQVQQDVQPAAEKKTADQPQVSLTKLGNELHGPTDKMHIAHDQILFWENLKDDSTVVKAIKDYKAKQ